MEKIDIKITQLGKEDPKGLKTSFVKTEFFLEKVLILL